MLSQLSDSPEMTLSVHGNQRKFLSRHQIKSLFLTHVDLLMTVFLLLPCRVTNLEIVRTFQIHSNGFLIGYKDLEEEKRSRRVFFELIDPDETALTIQISCRKVLSQFSPHFDHQFSSAQSQFLQFLSTLATKVQKI